ncbi:hypothetical protein [Limosilactobacillus reuteri]|uniref:hypothetical protein n=1 Tax=Limosilactobacillus reuteri TaxID=1598 RepID=UPI003D9663A2
MTNNNEEKNLKGIQRYYTRTLQSEHGNNYYIEPKDTCPMDVLNDKERFVILTFDKKDDYIVIDDKRYYLNKYNSIKATNKIQQRVAIVDLKELKKSKTYPFDNDYRRQYTSQFKNFDELKNLAKQQWLVNGAPYIKQVAMYNEKEQRCRYYYEPSCDRRIAIA